MHVLQLTSIIVVFLFLVVVARIVQKAELHLDRRILLATAQFRHVAHTHTRQGGKNETESILRLLLARLGRCDTVCCVRFDGQRRRRRRAARRHTRIRMASIWLRNGMKVGGGLFIALYPVSFCIVLFARGFNVFLMSIVLG